VSRGIGLRTYRYSIWRGTVPCERARVTPYIGLLTGTSAVLAVGEPGMRARLSNRGTTSRNVSFSHARQLERSQETSPGRRAGAKRCCAAMTARAARAYLEKGC